MGFVRARGLSNFFGTPPTDSRQFKELAQVPHESTRAWDERREWLLRVDCESSDLYSDDRRPCKRQRDRLIKMGRRDMSLRGAKPPSHECRGGSRQPAA